MKKYLVTTALVLAATASFAAISGTKHDFVNGNGGAYKGNNPTNQVCIYCHAPHNGYTATLLWNRSYAGPTTVTPYSNPASMDSTPSSTLGDASKTCLSCHDGSKAIDLYATSTGSTGPAIGVTSKANIGTDLRNDHPVSLTYNASLVSNDGQLNAAASFSSTLPLFGSSSDQLECATCHDVHNKYSQPSLLRIAPTNSAICVKCHIK